MLSLKEQWDTQHFKFCINGLMSESFQNSFVESRLLVLREEELSAYQDNESYVPVLLDIVSTNPTESQRCLVYKHFGYWECKDTGEKVDPKLQELATKRGYLQGEMGLLPELLVFYSKGVEQEDSLIFNFASCDKTPNSKGVLQLDYHPICFEDKVIFCWKDSEVYSILHRN